MSAEHRFELLSLPGWSRAESLKMLFHLAKQPFLDRQLNINAWQAYKQKMALPSNTFLPILRDNKNCSIVGVLNIGRYLSRQFGYYAETTIEQTKIEEMLGYIDTLHASYMPVIRATLLKNTELRMSNWLDYRTQVLVPVLDFFVRRLGQNDYFISNRLTFVDIAILELLAKLSILCEPDLLVSYPTLNAHRERIESMPCFETYLIKRARTFF